MRGDRAGRPQLRRLLAPLALLAAALPARAQAPEPAAAAVDNWQALRAALQRCWQIPEGTEGSLVAFRFGLDKTGAMRGSPRVTARRLTGDAKARERYAASARRLIETCFPLPVTPGFGAVLGESPIVLRLVNTKPTAAYQINANITLFAPPHP